MPVRTCWGGFPYAITAWEGWGQKELPGPGVPRQIAADTLWQAPATPTGQICVQSTCQSNSKRAWRGANQKVNYEKASAYTKKAPQTRGFFVWNNDLAATYFPTVRTGVSSALESLTAEFGMGSGVSSPQWLPGQIYKYIVNIGKKRVKTHGLLVLVS